MYELFANLTLIVHLIFILFVIFGGLLFFIFSKVFYIHFPALLWGIYIELTNSVCPLTYLENWFLNKAELATYSNGFINNYLYPIIYPEGLTNNIQIYLGITLIVINILIYGFIFKNFKRF
tara:strand:- start:476 stop:838 length:363 start_codon:yes stop_codon:yes gene_type:complete